MCIKVDHIISLTPSCGIILCGKEFGFFYEIGIFRKIMSFIILQRRWHITHCFISYIIIKLKIYTQRKLWITLGFKFFA